MLLVDSSAWVLFTRGEINLEAFVSDEDAATCPPVIQEILQGVDSPRRYARTREALFRGKILDVPMPLERFEQAAQLYRHCRDEGVLVRKSADYLIACVALAHNIAVLHRDRDFDNIARVTSLKSVRC